MGVNFRALDANYDTIGILLPTDIQWSRSYYECGTFSIQIPVDQYSNEMKYIYWKDRPELGVISQQNYEIKKSVQFVQLSGYFLENELNDKVIYPLYTSTGNIEDAVVDMVKTYSDDIPLLDTITASQSRGLSVDFQESNATLANKAYELLKDSEMSIRMDYDYVTNSKTFSVWKGVDRTQSQGENNFVVFSTKFGNLENPNVYIEDTDYKNYAVIGGQAIDDVTIHTTLDLSGGGYQKQTYIDASSVAYDDTLITLAQYKLNLQTYAATKLGLSVNNVTFDAIADSYEYMSDYDLGDKCDIIIDEIGLELEARIISIAEVIESNEHTITLEFGDQIIR